jgi:hypothetical protein
MSIWIQYNNDEKLVMLQQTAASKSVLEQAVEKDWWVSAVLKELKFVVKHFIILIILF